MHPATPRRRGAGQPQQTAAVRQTQKPPLPAARLLSTTRLALGFCPRGLSNSTSREPRTSPTPTTTPLVLYLLEFRTKLCPSILEATAAPLSGA